MPYDYDIFISYNSAQSSLKEWVVTYFLRLFEEYCDLEFGERDHLRYYVWHDNVPGAIWPESIQDAHSRSKLLLAILTPSYFTRSQWCLAEWEVMRERERLIPPGGHVSLIYPIIWSDGSLIKAQFDPLAYVDFTQYAFPDPGFRETPRFVQFREEMRALVYKIKARRDIAPPFQDWPRVLDVNALVLATRTQLVPRM